MRCGEATELESNGEVGDGERRAGEGGSGGIVSGREQEDDVQREVAYSDGGKG